MEGLLHASACITALYDTIQNTDPNTNGHGIACIELCFVFCPLAHDYRVHNHAFCLHVVANVFVVFAAGEEMWVCLCYDVAACTALLAAASTVDETPTDRFVPVASVGTGYTH
jgi:hypothetical protein